MSALKIGRIVSGLALACLLGSPCAQAENDQKPELSEATSNALEKLQTFVSAKNWDGALDLLNGALSKAAPDSYDLAYIDNVIARIYLQKGDFPSMIKPWETVVSLQETHHYLDDKDVQEIIYSLAQLYFQDAQNSKVLSVTRQNYAKAFDMLNRWLKNTTKPAYDQTRQEAQIFLASLLYGQATLVPNEIDFKKLDEAQTAIDAALKSATHPKETLYQFSLAIAQQENKTERLGEILELMVKQSPQKKDYWSQLENVYLTLAASDKSERKVRGDNIRAILTLERAQALGFLKTPKDNFALVGLYFNVQQFGRATELLHAGLRNGTIESDLDKWELLASCYQQVDKPYVAIDALKEGSNFFPHSGQLNFQSAQIYYSLNKSTETYDELQVATRKGEFKKPGATYGFLAYVCWDLGKFEEALNAVNKALEYPDSKRDENLPKLKKAIQDAITERENAKAAAHSN